MQMEIVNTYKRKLVGEKMHKVVKIRYINIRVECMKIKKREIIEHIQGTLLNT